MSDLTDLFKMVGLDLADFAESSMESATGICKKDGQCKASNVCLSGQMCARNKVDKKSAIAELAGSEVIR